MSRRPLLSLSRDKARARRRAGVIVYRTAQGDPCDSIDRVYRVSGADLSLRHGLAMADAIVYAAAEDQEAEVVTGDADLKDLPGVVFVK